MTDVRVAVIAVDELRADMLLGVVPPDAKTTIVLLGVTSEGVPAGVRDLPAADIVAVPDVGEECQADVAGAVLVDLVRDFDVVVLDSAQGRRDLAGWLCAKLDRPLVWAIDALRLGAGGGIEADRVVSGGSYRLVHYMSGPAVVLAKPTDAASYQDRPRAGAPAIAQLSVAVPRSRVRVLSAGTGRNGSASLAAARTIISIGRGIGGPERVNTYRELAARTGAALGASRVAVDAGWIPFAHQVGQTGTSVAPDVYVAFGISGAVQHLAGMRASKRVVAINTDDDAPMCRIADLVVKADANEVADALLKKAAEAGC